MIQRMGEFLEESARTINYVRVFVNGQWLLAKIWVVSINDIATHQTPLVVILPVTGIGRKIMRFRYDLSALLTFLVVHRLTIILGIFIGKLHP